MLLPRLRFTVRRLMVAVLVVALIFGGGLTLRRRRQVHLEWAAFCARQQGEWEAVKDGDAIVSPSQSLEETRSRARILATYFADLAREFHRAAAYPWVSVRLDPAMSELAANKYLKGARVDLPPPTLPAGP